MPDYDYWRDQQESTTVTVDGHDLEVAYYAEGDGDPLVFLHGIPTSSFLWRDVAPAFTDEYRVIAPDMVGYGASAMHDGFDRSIRAQEVMIDELLQDELNTFDFEISFVGHDLGGGVGLRYAAHNPEDVENLVLSNAVAYDSWPIETITNIGLPDWPQETSVEEAQEMLNGLFRDTLFADDPDEEFVEGMKAPWSDEEGLVSLSRNAIATNTSHTTEVDPSEITAETLLLWGANDDFQPLNYAERLDEDVPASSVEALENANHWVPQDRTDAYIEELRAFLE
jgi:pimeloyl-ACP methyl ester carboxylesterase